MEKYLRVKVWEKDEKWFWKVTRQSHVEEKFGKTGSTFYASNDFVLASANFPTSDCYFGHRSGAFVRGRSKKYNKDICTAPSKAWIKKLLFAVAEYNTRG